MPYDARGSQSKQLNAKHIYNAELCARRHFKYHSMRPTAAHRGVCSSQIRANEDEHAKTSAT